MDIKKVIAELNNYYNQNTKVVNWVEPDDLLELIEFDLSKQFKDDDHIVDQLTKIINFSVRTDQKHFYNQLYTGSDPYTTLCEMLVTMLNQSMYTYEMAPVFTMMELSTFNKIKEVFHFEQGGALMTPGGSLSNILAIHAARYNYDHNINIKGNSNYKFKIFVSNDSHYSIKKGCMLLGLGVDSVIPIRCKWGVMDADDLEDKIVDSLENSIPLMVVATAGTTVFGAFDPIDKISYICQKYNIWLHVDGAYGGSLMFSKKRNLLNGIEMANSMTWNPHKMLRVPLQCSILLLRDKMVLDNFNSIDVSYLFADDKYYDPSYDTGKKHILCGRRADILKLWMVWKRLGYDGLRRDLDYVLDLAKKLSEKITVHKNFTLIKQPISTNVCFYVHPTNLNPNIELNYSKLDNLAPKIKKKMVDQGDMMVSYQKSESENLPNFFRIVIINPNLVEKDLDDLIAMFQSYLEDL